VVLNLAGFYESNVVDWVDAINATIDTVVLKLPSARRVVLQAVIGGPGHQLCTNGSQVVQASASHPYIDEAIAIVVAARAGTLPEVIAGISPEVRDCSDYDDGLGHLTRSGAVAAAQSIGNYYAALDAGCIAPPQPPCAFPATLYATLLTNSMLELRWEACDTNYQYQLEHSRNLADWRNAGPPYAAPAGGGWLTNIVNATNSYTFFRVRADAITHSPVPASPGIYPSLFFTHDGLLRSYRLMIPTNYNPGVSNALALILHGHGPTADSFAALHPALFFHAQTNNLILVLPDSTTDERSTGWNNRDPEPGQYLVNDVSYLLALIDQLDATLTLDRARLYVGGFSSGGVMTHYLGARTTNVFAALAAVEASIGAGRGTDTSITNPPAAGPMPVFVLNCTERRNFVAHHCRRSLPCASLAQSRRPPFALRLGQPPISAPGTAAWKFRAALVLVDIPRNGNAVQTRLD
jgi:predicted esterase